MLVGISYCITVPIEQLSFYSIYIIKFKKIKKFKSIRKIVQWTVAR